MRDGAGAAMRGVLATMNETSVGIGGRAGSVPVVGGGCSVAELDERGGRLAASAAASLAAAASFACRSAQRVHLKKPPRSKK